MPTFVILGIITAYPVVRLVIMSFQEYTAAQLYGTPAEWIGFDNYVEVLTDPEFHGVILRSLGLMIVCVVLTMVLGTLVALLMMRLGKGMRTMVSVGLLLAWGMPALTATIVWGWIVDPNGILNYLLSVITGDDWSGHSWLANPISFLAVAAVIIVWGAVPFVCFTMYAGLTQIPGEVLEAAQLDGAGKVKTFRLIQIPFVTSIIAVLVVLSVIWDLRVFAQIYALQGMGGVAAENSTIGVYIYQTAFSSANYGLASAMGVILTIALMAISYVYIRRTVKEEGL
ncbi:carbohydrate ABC transporter permease [Sediminihabitans luteus]|uniref:carbohydrate ABC transporter permease n=1 Tax=Sediminihabitans luteus TaxID=1138585 RepID=UPI001EF35534|nr:sugar ABC transporter permease [Sediminihabitans luteus]